MRLHCPDCGVEIPADDVNIQLAIAKCGRCGAVSISRSRAGAAFASQQGPAGSSIVAEPRERPTELPAGLRVDADGGDFAVERRWRGSRTVPLTLFAMVWCGFLAFWIQRALERDEPNAHVLLIFAAFHGLVGLLLVYTTLASWLNSTWLRANEHELLVPSGPLPWPGNRTISSHDVEQIFCKERRRRQKSQLYRSHELWVALKDGEKRSILRNLGTEEQALWLEDRLEEVLRIEDRPVSEA